MMVLETFERSEAAINRPTGPQDKARLDAEAEFTVHFLLLPGFSLISFSAAIEPLRMANKTLRRPCFRYVCCSVDGRPVAASNGIEVGVTECADTITRTDLLMICSSDGVETIELPAATRQAIRRLCHGGVRVAGICTGAFILGRLGLLRDRKCTIHWEYADYFREAFPRSELTDCIFQEDGQILTCAGGDAAFDLMVGIIQDKCGDAVAGAVRDIALHGQPRPASDAQRSDLRSRLGVQNEMLIACVKLMEDNIEQPLSMAALSVRVGMSRRNIERMFKKHLNASPSTYYRVIRLQAARRLVEQSDLPIFEIAIANGFETASNFSKWYKLQFGLSPTRDRSAGRGTVPA